MDDEKTFRAFFAVEIPDDIRQQISKNLGSIKQEKRFEAICWVPENNLHITLRFLGDITEAQSKLLVQKATEGLKTVKPFSISLVSIIPFPPDDDYHILAIKPKPITSLAALALLLEGYAIVNGLPKEKKVYTPHLTIGQKKEQHEFPKIDKEIKMPNLKFDVREIKLLRSDRTKEGSKYTEVSTIRLNG